MERIAIAINDSTQNKLFYNISDGDHGGNTFAGYTEQEFEQYRKSLCGKGNPFYGKKHSEETKKLYSTQRTGSNHPNYGKSMSENQKKLLSEKAKQRCSNPNFVNPNNKVVEVFFKNGTFSKYQKITDFNKETPISKGNYLMLKNGVIPKFKSKEKREYFQTIDKIIVNNICIYNSTTITSK